MHHRSILLGIFCTLQPLANAGSTTTIIDNNVNWGTWEGWGVSLAWWAKAFGDRDVLADLFFSSKMVNYKYSSIPGLALNMVRYNAGASSYNSINESVMEASPNMTPSRQMEGFWMDGNSSDPSSNSWDWSVDKNQRDMLSKARERGVNVFELFSNSPMWWMCNNLNPSGNIHTYDDNLREDSYDKHAIYLATIAQRAKQDWNITFSSIDPFNEPMSMEWSEDGDREGCHYDVATQSVVIGHLRKQLDIRGLHSTIISASDEAFYEQAISTWNSMPKETKKLIDRINVHGYHHGEGHRGKLHALVAEDDKGLWNSAYAEGDVSGKSLVSSLMLDLTMLHPTGWLYWQPVDSSGWGLVDGDNEDVSLGLARQKYFLLAQFTRHIRPGMRILSGGNDNTIAAYDAATEKLVIVAVNWAHGRQFTFKLANFRQPGVKKQVVRSWKTHMGKNGPYYAAVNGTTMTGGKFHAWVDSQVVQTFEVTNVTSDVTSF